jgi:hypothetical protein
MTYKPFLPTSLLREHGDQEFGAKRHEYSNYSIKSGVILKSYDVDDELNINGLTPEYDVSVYEQDEDRGVTSTIYKNCIYIDAFGGVADFFETRRRTPTNDEYKSKQEIENYDGSLVLVLCLDGSADKGIIIGAITHPNRKNTLTKSNEIHTEGEFNGIRISVDKDGAITITQKTATDNDGKPKDTSAAGSQWKIEKDGSTEINTAPITPELSGGNRVDAEPGSENKEPSANLEYDRIRIDRPKKTIQIEARENIDMVADKDLTAKVEENMDLQIKKDLLIKAEGKANVEIMGNVDFKTDANVKAKMMNLQMTIDNAAQIQMQTMNLIAQQLTVNGGSGLLLTCAQTLVNSPLVILGTQPQPALIPNTSFLGIGNLGVPVISTAIGPFSSQVMLSS